MRHQAPLNAAKEEVFCCFVAAMFLMAPFKNVVQKSGETHFTPLSQIMQEKFSFLKILCSPWEALWKMPAYTWRTPHHYGTPPRRSAFRWRALNYHDCTATIKSPPHHVHHITTTTPSPQRHNHTATITLPRSHWHDHNAPKSYLMVRFFPFYRKSYVFVRILLILLI